jgi:hypothetical protein
MEYIRERLNLFTMYVFINKFSIGLAIGNAFIIATLLLNIIFNKDDTEGIVDNYNELYFTIAVPIKVFFNVLFLLHRWFCCSSPLCLNVFTNTIYRII